MIKLKGIPLELVALFGGLFLPLFWVILTVSFIENSITQEVARALLILTPVTYLWYKITEDMWNKKDKHD